jgi:enamine deaminase RidA (YjgF/YER057c/UK114 family)
MREHHIRPDGLPSPNGYSHAVTFSGRMVVVSGQTPTNAAGVVVGGDAETQTRQVFENLRIALASAGAELDQIVKITVFLVDLDDLAAFRRVRDEFLSTELPPASTLVLVSGLIQPAFRVEVEAIAAI